MELLGSYSNRTVVLNKLITITHLKATDRSPDQAKRSPDNRHRRLTPKQTKKLIERYLGGETVYQLGKAYRINRKTVSIVLKREGVKTRHRKLSDRQVRRAIKLYESGLSVAAVGEKFAAHATTIQAILKRNGIKTRQVGTNQHS